MILSVKGSSCDDGQEGQTTRLASWRSQDAAFFTSCTTRNGVFAQVVAAGGISWAPALTAHAGHWTTVPRVADQREAGTFRVIYRADTDAVVILNVFLKKTQQT